MNIEPYPIRTDYYRTSNIKSKCFVHVDDVLEIIDGHKYRICWSISEKLWNENMDKIKAKVLELKGM